MPSFPSFLNSEGRLENVNDKGCFCSLLWENVDEGQTNGEEGELWAKNGVFSCCSPPPSDAPTPQQVDPESCMRRHPSFGDSMKPPPAVKLPLGTDPLENGFAILCSPNTTFFIFKGNCVLFLRDFRKLDLITTLNATLQSPPRPPIQLSHSLLLNDDSTDDLPNPPR